MQIKTLEELEDDGIKLIDWQGKIEDQIAREQGNGKSHEELDPTVWHPSQLAMLPDCPRQAVVRKLNLEENGTRDNGVFHAGSRWHRWVEENVTAPVFKEHPLQLDIEPTEEEKGQPVIRIRGRADAWDPINKVVYDHKSTASTGNWGKTFENTKYPEDFFEDHERHKDYRDQLQVYMAALGGEVGRLIYSHKCDEAIRPYPLNGAIAFNPERFKEIIRAARELTKTLQEAYTDDQGQVKRGLVLEALKHQDPDNGDDWAKCGRDKCWNCKAYENLHDEIETKEVEA